MKPKKVLFVINTLGKAGAEVALLELLNRLIAREGIAGQLLGETPLELSLYVITGQGELAEALPEEVALLNKHYKSTSVLSAAGRRDLAVKVAMASLRRASLLRNLPYMVRNALPMLKAKRLAVDKLLWRVLSDGAEALNEEYDLAIAYLEGGSSYLVADHIKAKQKAAFIHIDYSLAGYTRALDKDCYLAFGRIFTVSSEVKDRFLEYYPECEECTYVFHNILDEANIRAKAAEGAGFADDYDGIRILTVGRLVYQKAYELAIEAMALLKTKGVQARWYVLGEGNLRSSLEAQIKAAGLEEDFILLGAVDNPYPYFSQADIYAHFTRFEGKSIAIQEAQILGKAIAASDCSGNREQIIPGVDGLLCTHEPKAMAEALLELIGNEDKRRRFGELSCGKQMAYEEDIRLLLEMLQSLEGIL